MSILRSLLVLSALLVSIAHADTLTGRVVGVADGDTITVLDANRQQHKIRLQGIDAPGSQRIGLDGSRVPVSERERAYAASKCGGAAPVRQHL